MKGKKQSKEGINEEKEEGRKETIIWCMILQHDASFPDFNSN